MRNFLLFFLVCLAAPAFSQDLYDLKHIPEIRISFAEKDWSARLDSMKLAGMEGRLEATVEIDGKKFQQVGVRYKGNSSYKNPKQKGIKKLPFNLKSNFVVKDQLFPGGFETLKLSNVFQDPSFLREVLSYEIARKYMPAPRCNFAKVWVNGEYFGLYNNAESVDEKFLEKAFGTGKGTLIKCDPEWEDVKDLENDCPEGDKASLMYTGDDPSCYAGWYELQNNTKKAWRELIALTKTLQQPDKIPSVLNVDAALWMHAFNHVLVNLDSYTGRLSHNYYLYKTPDSLFTPIVWDMNISFGGFRFDGEKQGVLTDEEMQSFSLFVHYKNKNP
ncbi:MAG: CotH kinase family protein, partial [Bacteroidota bacterium]